MEIGPEFQELASALANSAIRNSAQMIVDKVGALKSGGRAQETIAGLEQIINDLISDKNDLTRIANAYQAELVAQRLSPGDVKYITDTVVPLIEKLATQSGNASAVQTTQMIDMLKPLLSVETVNVLQIVGFNFRAALGEPLTKLVESAILSKAAPTEEAREELEQLKLRRELAYAELAKDADAYARLQKLYGF